MTFTKILCPIDFSPGAQRALAVAARMAGEAGAELVIAHSWHIPALAYSMEAPLVTHGVVDEATQMLAAAVAEARAAGAKYVTTKLVNGLPWVEIIGMLESKAFDLCVVGTHGRTGLSRVLLGSVAEKVVRHAPCPVLAIRLDSDSKPFHHVLVPTDFSESAVAALELATKLVEPTGAITLMHVIEAPVAELGHDFTVAATGALTRQIERSHRTSTIAITPRTRIGAAGGQTLAELDADPTIDLVVMGSHGRTGIKRALLGSVAEKMVRHARCPVLVARTKARHG